MKGKKLLLALLTAVILAGSPLTALGRREREPSPYTGKVTVKGSEPHSWVALTTEDTQFRITGPLTEEIRNEHQGRRLSVKGIIVKDETGPGFPAELEVSAIIEVHN